MITLAMPVGSSHGWGICGKYVAREMARLTEMRLLTDPFTLEAMGDELEYHAVASLRIAPAEIPAVSITDGTATFPHPLLTCIVDKTLRSWKPNIRGTPTVGYTFFEENNLEKTWIDAAAQAFDKVTTGSSWCTQVLQSYGMKNVHTVIQGIDPRVFFPWPAGGVAEREFLRSRFVVFSGGKFELRKGQDIVIRAAKIMQERHSDVVLVNAWYNAWPQSIETMRGSPYLHWPASAGQNYLDMMRRLLGENGLDLSRVVILGPRSNALMARVYRNSDVGVFPNRCEGGTNLVLMEYMACGKPVVAVASTGHSDVVRASNALVVQTKGVRVFNGPGGPAATWPEPDLDDCVDKLEWAYRHRAEAAALGARAGADLAQLTWTKTAQSFLDLLAT